MDFFFEIHKDLPREGPGDSASTKKAFSKLVRLPEKPNILDVGCGPGVQTIDLANLVEGTIHAVDTHQPFLDVLQQKINSAGLQDRITLHNQSMKSLDFPPASFDLIWSEGAIYIMGFENGLRSWKRLLKPHGYIAVTELSWLKPDPPAEVKAFWQQGYPGMKQLEENLEIIYKNDYYLIDYFVLPETSWINEYYQPMQARIEMLHEKYKDEPQKLAILEDELLEIRMYEKYKEWYGYVFYIMQNKELE